MVELKDGGVLIIPEESKKRWSEIYQNVDIDKVINELNETGIFKNCSKQKALKLINKTLEEKDNLREA